MNETTEQFGEQLRHRRKREGETQAALADRAGMRVSHLSDIERGQRPCGPAVAARLASALGIAGDELTTFACSAATTTERGHLWTTAPDLNVLTDMLTRQLRRRGVDDRQMIAASLVPSQARPKSGDILLLLEDGTRAHVEINVRTVRGAS